MADDHTSCTSTGGCGGKKPWRALLTGLVLAIYTFAFDFVVNGVLFSDLYKANAQHFRPPEEMMAFMPLCILYHLAMGILVAKGYRKWRKYAPLTPDAYPMKKTFAFSIWVGLLLGVPQLMVAVWTPIPAALPLLWFGSELVKWTFCAPILAKLYGKASV